MKESDINGWIFLDKPIGVSSNRVLQKVRKIFNHCKAGYVGTLDPLASGFLPIALGKSTKTIKYLSNSYKEYVFEVTWGIHSSTGDLEGEIIKIDKKYPTLKKIKNIYVNFVGDYYQVPHKFSSKKVNGKKAYELARKKLQVDLKKEKKEILDLKIINQISKSKTLFYIKCSSGTYIRSLAEDMAEALNTLGVVSSLRRVGFGNLDKKLISLDYLLSLVHIEGHLSILRPIEEVFNEFNQIHLDMKEVALILNGRPIEMNEIRNKINDFCGQLALAKFKNKLVAVGYLKDGNFYPKNLLSNFFV
ncbi:MAG: tRNA pseudouridine(55) synthase TruB [Rickettsiales bacterium]|nr:tRNA pseudouridine(55) synthase TruB [Rickettsiales bacterium]RPG12785.1 MAG: tRNA pseudouridine(55) synthase TruB [Pelagibacteraceae bacterium TMED195]|tara:strand:- start:1274 stop:2185 length:912 start_codon:yes stop_codon:yes gene_type:complete